MSGPGTTTIVDDAAAAIIAQNALITTQNATLVTMLAAQQAAAINMGGCWEKLADIEIRLRSAEARAVEDSANMKTVLTGMASISNTMQAQSTTTKMMYLDQQKNNQFTQTATNAALARGGHPAVVVPPADIVATIQTTIQEVTTLNAQVAATNLVTNAIQDSISSAYTTSTQWFAQTIVGTFLAEQYASLKAGVAYIFSAEFIKDAVDAGKRLVNNAKAGG
jgi:hypothetical protein